MPLPFRKLKPAVLCQRMPAHVHALRLESSPLYIRRQREAMHTHQTSILSATWYLDAKFQPRYLDAEVKR